MRLALRQHGVAAGAASIVAAVGDAFRRQAIRLSVEIASIFDRDTGTPVGPYQTGRANEVDLSDQLASLAPDRRYVAIHTHRESTAFSEWDVDFLLRNLGVETIAAVGHDGTWYLLSKTPEAKTAAQGVAAVRAAVRALAPDYLAAVHAGKMTRQDATRRLLHATWQFIARPLGLRYDRVE